MSPTVVCVRASPSRLRAAARERPHHGRALAHHTRAGLACGRHHRRLIPTPTVVPGYLTAIAGILRILIAAECGCSSVSESCLSDESRMATPLSRRSRVQHQQPVRSRARSRQETGGLVVPWRRLLRVAGLRRAWMMGRWTG